MSDSERQVVDLRVDCLVCPKCNVANDLIPGEGPLTGDELPDGSMGDLATIVFLDEQRRLICHKGLVLRGDRIRLSCDENAVVQVRAILLERIIYHAPELPIREGDGRRKRSERVAPDAIDHDRTG